jgi:hypothetical protein
MTEIFSFDAETDGLYGPVWAIGAVVYDDADGVTDAFSGQLDPGVVTDSWVRDHIVPVVHLPRYDHRDQLLDAFWAFWEKHRLYARCVADFGAPVEAGLFRACIERDLPGRQWSGPYPMHELGTALLLAGVDPDVNRREYARAPHLVPHDPVDDAVAAALCWNRAVSSLKGNA